MAAPSPKIRSNSNECLLIKTDLNDDLNDTDSWRLSIIDAIQQKVYFLTKIVIRSLTLAFSVTENGYRVSQCGMHECMNKLRSSQAFSSKK
jgi:hypothetical protein